MSEFKALLISETDKARLFRVVDREVWVPKSLTLRITKFPADTHGHRECIVDAEDWFCDKEGL